MSEREKEPSQCVNNEERERRERDDVNRERSKGKGEVTYRVRGRLFQGVKEAEVSE